MGTDIHMVAERFDGARWRLVGEAGKTRHGRLRMPEPYDGRNYDLFAILADVRNGRGVAGIKTGSGFEIMAEPRGVPVDCSPEFRQWAEDWSGHTPSWVTLAEILAFDWTRLTTRRGCVGVLNMPYELGDKPHSWCGAHMGRDIQERTYAEMAAIRDQVRKMPRMWEYREIPWECPAGWSPELHALAKNSICYVEWQETYASCCEDFWSTTVPALLRMGPPGHVRICFFFDS